MVSKLIILIGPNSLSDKVSHIIDDNSFLFKSSNCMCNKKKKKFEERKNIENLENSNEIVEIEQICQEKEEKEEREDDVNLTLSHDEEDISRALKISNNFLDYEIKNNINISIWEKFIKIKDGSKNIDSYSTLQNILPHKIEWFACPNGIEIIHSKFRPGIRFNSVKLLAEDGQEIVYIYSLTFFIKIGRVLDCSLKCCCECQGKKKEENYVFTSLTLCILNSNNNMKSIETLMTQIYSNFIEPEMIIRETKTIDQFDSYLYIINQEKRNPNQNDENQLFSISSYYKSLCLPEEKSKLFSIPLQLIHFINFLLYECPSPKKDFLSISLDFSALIDNLNRKNEKKYIEAFQKNEETNLLTSAIFEPEGSINWIQRGKEEALSFLLQKLGSKGFVHLLAVLILGEPRLAFTKYTKFKEINDNNNISLSCVLNSLSQLLSPFPLPAVSIYEVPSPLLLLMEAPVPFCLGIPKNLLIPIMNSIIKNKLKNEEENSQNNNQNLNNSINSINPEYFLLNDGHNIQPEFQYSSIPNYSCLLNSNYSYKNPLNYSDLIKEEVDMMIVDLDSGELIDLTHNKSLSLLKFPTKTQNWLIDSFDEILRRINVKNYCVNSIGSENGNSQEKDIILSPEILISAIVNDLLFKILRPLPKSFFSLGSPCPPIFNRELFLDEFNNNTEKKNKNHQKYLKRKKLDSKENVTVSKIEYNYQNNESLHFTLKEDTSLFLDDEIFLLRRIILNTHSFAILTDSINSIKNSFYFSICRKNNEEINRLKLLHTNFIFYSSMYSHLLEKKDITCNSSLSLNKNTKFVSRLISKSEAIYKDLYPNWIACPSNSELISRYENVIEYLQNLIEEYIKDNENDKNCEMKSQDEVIENCNLLLYNDNTDDKILSIGDLINKIALDFLPYLPTSTQYNETSSPTTPYTLTIPVFHLLEEIKEIEMYTLNEKKYCDEISSSTIKNSIINNTIETEKKNQNEISKNIVYLASNRFFSSSPNLSFLFNSNNNASSKTPQINYNHPSMTSPIGSICSPLPTLLSPHPSITPKLEKKSLWDFKKLGTIIERISEKSYKIMKKKREKENNNKVNGENEKSYENVSKMGIRNSAQDEQKEYNLRILPYLQYIFLKNHDTPFFLSFEDILIEKKNQNENILKNLKNILEQKKNKNSTINSEVNLENENEVKTKLKSDIDETELNLLINCIEALKRKKLRKEFILMLKQAKLDNSDTFFSSLIAHNLIDKNDILNGNKSEEEIGGKINFLSTQYLNYSSNFVMNSFHNSSNSPPSYPLPFGLFDRIAKLLLIILNYCHSQGDFLSTLDIYQLGGLYHCYKEWKLDCIEGNVFNSPAITSYLNSPPCSCFSHCYQYNSPIVSNLYNSISPISSSSLISPIIDQKISSPLLSPPTPCQICNGLKGVELSLGEKLRDHPILRDPHYWDHLLINNIKKNIINYIRIEKSTPTSFSPEYSPIASTSSSSIDTLNQLNPIFPTFSSFFTSEKSLEDYNSTLITLITYESKRLILLMNALGVSLHTAIEFYNIISKKYLEEKKYIDYYQKLYSNISRKSKMTTSDPKKCISNISYDESFDSLLKLISKYWCESVDVIKKHNKKNINKIDDLEIKKKYLQFLILKRNLLKEQLQENFILKYQQGYESEIKKDEEQEEHRRIESAKENSKIQSSQDQEIEGRKNFVEDLLDNSMTSDDESPSISFDTYASLLSKKNFEKQNLGNEKNIIDENKNFRNSRIKSNTSIENQFPLINYHKINIDVRFINFLISKIKKITLFFFFSLIII